MGYTTTRPATRRRSPIQQRSRAKVDAIIGAVERIAAEDIGSLTTSRIAEEAGISVGSLYQYFENREDIVDRILERYLAELEELTEKTFADGHHTTVSDAAAELAQQYVEYVRSHAAFRALWYSNEFVTGIHTIEGRNDHVLANRFAELAHQHGLVGRLSEDLRDRFLVMWVAIDAILELAFRLDDQGDPATLSELANVISCFETVYAAA